MRPSKRVKERVARPRVVYSLQRVKAVVWYARVLG